MKQVETKILDSRVGTEFSLPEYKCDGDAGMDIRAMPEKQISLQPGESTLIPTGIAIHINDPYLSGDLRPRSGLGQKQGLVLGNLTGTIDCHYREELMIPAWNRNPPFVLREGDLSNDFLWIPLGPGSKSLVYNYEGVVVVNPGDRIAQLVFNRIERVELVVVENFSSEKSDRESGFGHTGVR